MSTYAGIRPIERPGLAVWMAWRRYLITVRASTPETYVVTEESAWNRLQEDLASTAGPLPDQHVLHAA